MRPNFNSLFLIIVVSSLILTACYPASVPEGTFTQTPLQPSASSSKPERPTALPTIETQVTSVPTHTPTPIATQSPTPTPTFTLTPTQPPSVTSTPSPQEPTAAPISKGDLISDRTLPDLGTRPPTDLRLLYNANTGRALIRFTNSIYNSGPGVLELVGVPNRAQEQIRVFQRLYAADPEIFDEYEIGEFLFHDEHDHWHLDQFATYELWSVDATGSLDQLVSSRGKVSWCVMDETLTETDPPGEDIPERPVYTHCEGKIQGLSVGWTDIYEYYLPGQWVEVDTLEDGLYALVSTVDPDHLLYEVDIDNNTGVTYIEIRDLRLVP